MIEFILVLFVYVGPMSDKDSVAITSIPGFKSEKECAAAGDASKPLVSATTKNLRFACLKVTK